MNEPQVRDILRVLCRIPVADGQLGLYRLAVSSPDKGFTSTQVRALWNLDQAQHRGLMAALTVRINNTPRETSPDAKPGLGLLFNQRWDGHENTYRPHPELLEAVRRLPPLDALLRRPIEEVIATKSLSLTLPDRVPRKPAVAAPKSPLHPAQPFGALLDAFEAADLVYPPELIANLLLALQVKRFVILTGISGTGKTRIAQKLADYLGQSRRVAEVFDPGPDDLSAALQAHPDTMKRRRFVLPRSLAAQIPALEQVDGPATLKLTWPGGTATSKIWHRDATVVRMPSDLWSWFSKTVVAGQTFLVQLEGPPGAPDSVRLSLPAMPPQVRMKRLQNAEVVPVRPDWTDHRGLLGGYNPLTRQYMTTPFLRLLLRAAEEHELAASENRSPAPFFLILDEMNLARVEHYFADFLSALESGEPLHLHDSVEIEEGAADPDAGAPVPRRFPVPPNLFFLGTVNVDESTYLFSPKVLDRAFAMELNTVDLDGLSKGIERGGELDLGRWDGRLDPPAKPGRADWTWLVSQEEGALAGEVIAFHRLLAHHNRHFGYRVATEIARFVERAVAQATEPGDAAWAALDLALLQKVLVKLHGTRHELESVLDALLRFALVGATGTAEACDLARWRYVPEESVVRRKDETADSEALFPRSAAKLWRMRERIVETGFTSWIE